MTEHGWWVSHNNNLSPLRQEPFFRLLLSLLSSVVPSIHPARMANECVK